jgi:HD-like signal output (HDOD) protein
MSKIPTRQPELAELRALVPLRHLSDDLLELLRARADVLTLPKKSLIRQKSEKQNQLLFLISGDMQIRDNFGELQPLSGGSARSNFPLAPEGSVELDAVCSNRCEILRLPLKALQQARNLAAAEAAEAAANPPPELTEEERLEDQICDDFRKALAENRLELPGMPEVASRISIHIESPTSTSTSIARIVQTDPSITARLIQVANSAAMAPRTPVRTCKDAITRLGRNSTRELVTSFVLKGLFRARSARIKRRMQELWKHSTHVAALCHVLCRHCPGFEPARALLIGLVHDIGIIPLLTHSHRYPDLMEDDQQMERTLQRLRGEVGAMTLESWSFDEEIVTAVREAENWYRNDSEEADYTDILVIAQLHAFLGTAEMTDLPRIDEVPAFNKLALGTLSPRLSLVILDEAKHEIEEMRRMLV